MTQPTSSTAELATLRRIAMALERLDPPAQDRVVGWLFDRYRRAEDRAAK